MHFACRLQCPLARRLFWSLKDCQVKAAIQSDFRSANSLVGGPFFCGNGRSCRGVVGMPFFNQAFSCRQFLDGTTHGFRYPGFRLAVPGAFDINFFPAGHFSIRLFHVDNSWMAPRMASVTPVSDWLCPAPSTSIFFPAGHFSSRR